MKDLMRQKIAVDQKVADLLIKQIQVESTSSANYLAMAGWCSMQGYENSAEFFFNQSNEERGHMLKIFKFLADMGIQPQVAKVGAVNHEFSSLRDVFETSLEMEIAVSDSIHEIVSACKKVNDYRTERFMNWFVDEQVEEEFIARRALEIMDLLGEDQKGLFMFDERVNNISYEKE